MTPSNDPVSAETDEVGRDVRSRVQDRMPSVQAPTAASCLSELLGQLERILHLPRHSSDDSFCPSHQPGSSPELEEIEAQSVGPDGVSATPPVSAGGVQFYMLDHPGP